MAAMHRHFRLHRSLLGDFGVALLLASTSCVFARMAAAVPPNVNLSQDAGSSRWARAAIGPDGSVAVVWEDDRYGNSEIVWRRFTMAGVPITPLVRVTNTPAVSIRADIACDAEGRSHVVWQEGESYSGTVHLCRLDASGQVVLSDLVVSTVAGYPRVSTLPTGESDVVWQQLLTADRDVHYRRFDTVGATVCDQRLTGGTASWVLRHPDVCTPTNGSAVVYWLDYLGQYQLFQGTITPDCQAASGSICNAAYEGAPGAAAWDEPVMVFPIYPAIYRYVSPGVYCPIPEGPGNKRSPDVAADNIQQYVAWQDTRNGNPDIYFSRFSACTNLSGDVRLTQNDASSDAPAVAARDGEWAVVWIDNRDGNREIYLTSKQLSAALAPMNLAAGALDACSIGLNWQDVCSNEDSFEVERKETSAGTWWLKATLPMNTVSWSDSNATAGLRYYYRVRSRNATGYSEYSNVVSAIPTVLPGQPTGLQAIPVSPIAFDLSWTDQATGEDGFEIQRREVGRGDWGSLSDRPGANMSAHTDAGVTPQTAYEYRIRSYVQGAASVWSMIAQAMTPSLPEGFTADILVKFGTESIEGATVYRDRRDGQGFQPLSELTDASGRVHDVTLRLGNRIRAEKKIYDHAAVKRDHEIVGNAMYTFWRESDRMQEYGPEDGRYDATMVSQQQAEYPLTLPHSIFKYNLLVSVQEDLEPDDPYWAKLASGFQAASNYLYQASDGQIAFETVAILDDRKSWREADMIIRRNEGDGANANVEGIWHGRIWPGPEQMHFPKIFISKKDPAYRRDPSQGEYYRAITHEFGHYALGLWDEYVDGTGDQGQWDVYRNNHPAECPKIGGPAYGVMDGQGEFSSSNDYLPNYLEPIDPLTVTKQYWERRMPCWDWIERLLEGQPPAPHIRKPQQGWFASPEPTSTDRLASPGEPGCRLDPQNQGTLFGPPVKVRILDSGVGSFERELHLTTNGAPADGATVWSLGRSGPLFLGRTDSDGCVRLNGLRRDDDLCVYHRQRDRSCATTFRVSATGGDPWQVDLATAEGLLSSGRVSDRRDAKPPGVAVDSRVGGTLTEPVVGLEIWSDEPLAGEPQVSAFAGAESTALAMTWNPAQGSYSGELTIDPADSLFDGTGLFEIVLADTAGNVGTFASSFTLGMADSTRSPMLNTGLTDLSIDADNVGGEQLTIASTCNAPSYFPPGFSAIQITDLISVHLAVDDAYPAGAALNVRYSDSRLSGVDETSLVLLRWWMEDRQWVPLVDAHVSTARDIISAPISSGGIYCVFATAMSDDSIPPNGITDLGAVGLPGQGSLEMDWTAPGDDGETGTATDYEIAYSQSMITEARWDSVPKLAVFRAPSPAGSHEVEEVQLPTQGDLYYMALRSRDEGGNLSPLSNVTYAISGVSDPNSRPGPPMNVQAVDAPADSGGAVLLTWNRSSDDGGGKGTVCAYRIYRSLSPSVVPTGLDTVAAGVTTYIDTDALAGLTYTYWVSAADSVQSTFGGEESAFSARNLGAPTGDFSSDGKVGLDDFSFFVDTYGIDSTAVEFDPLFDLDHNGDIYTGDVAALTDHFGKGGIPTTDPQGQNGSAQIHYRFVRGDGDLWYLDLSATAVANLAAYSFKVTYPSPGLALVEATADSARIVGNLLNREGGQTPVFLVTEPDAGTIWVANAIHRASTMTAPEGSGFLARITLSGSSIAGVTASDIVLMDNEKLLNYFAQASEVNEVATPLQPFLFQSYPNPFNGTTTIAFRVPQLTKVSLRLYDVQGRLIRTLVDGARPAGMHPIVWDGRSNAGHSVASGVYYYKLKTSGYEKSRKLVLLR